MEGETIGRRARRPIVRLDETVEDGLSLYRSLSRQLNGDPQKYVSILNAVLDHFLRVWVQHDHPRHQEYESFSACWPHDGPVKTFFGALSCPDLTASADSGSFKNVLSVIANALNVRLVIWKSIPGRPKTRPIHDIGQMAFPECHVLGSGPEGSSEIDHYDSLLEDESGKALIEYMHIQKGRLDLEAKEICWYGNSFECYNGYRPHSGQSKPNLSGRTDFLWVIAVSVKKPEQILVAIRMMDEALKRAPAQEMRTAHKTGGRHRPLRRFVSVDAEFKRVPLTEKDLKLELDGANDEREREEIRAGNPEHLCSTLTIAIDRHAVFIFHILDMLENATSTTVQCLHQLFQRILFNKQLIKLWFNYQIDIPVLQATIAHMYQGTPRRRHRVDTIVRGEMQSSWKIPTFKIRSPFLNGLRPVDVTFVNHDQPCTMHNSSEKSSDDSSEYLRSCPCWSGNIDITALLDSIGRQLRWRTDGPSNPTQPWSEDCLMQLRDWTMPKHGCNYGDFLRWTMEKDRLYPFFEYFKAIPDQLFPRSNNFHDPAQSVNNASMQEQRTAWYDSFGPGMETDDLKMGYAMGDVIGIALLMRFLMTTDDRMLFTARFTNYAVPVKDSSYCTVYPTKSQVPSTVTPSSSVPLVDDNPRLWSRRKVGLESLPNRNQYRGWGDKIGVDFYRPDQVDTTSMSYFEHEECAKVSRWAYESNYANLIGTNTADGYAYHAASATYNQILLEASLQTAHEDLFDPLKFQLPDVLTAQPPGLTVSSPDQKVIVRAGTTHTEDLINLIRQQRRRRNAHIYPPPGFRAPPGSSNGLPAGINRTPGYELGRDLPPAFDWPRSSQILQPPPPPPQPPRPGSNPPGNLPPGDGSLPNDGRGYDIYDQSGKRYRRDKDTSTGTSQGGGAITQHRQYPSNRPVSAVAPMTRTSYPQEVQRPGTQPNPYITPRTSGSYPGNRTTQPFPPNRPLGQFDLLHLHGREQQLQGETWQRHNRDVSAPPTHFGPSNPFTNIDSFRGPSWSSFGSAPITFRPPPAGPSRSAAIPIVAPPPGRRQTLGPLQSRPHPSSQAASPHVDFPLTDSTRDAGETAKSVDEAKRNQSRGGQQGIASDSAKRQDRMKGYWTEGEREMRRDKMKQEAEEMEKMESIERESATRIGSDNAVDNKVDSSNQHKDTEYHSDNDENDKDHDAGGGGGKGIRKNSVVKFGIVGLGKRKRVGDSDDRIGAVLERVEKMARSS